MWHSFGSISWTIMKCMNRPLSMLDCLQLPICLAAKCVRHLNRQDKKYKEWEKAKAWVRDGGVVGQYRTQWLFTINIKVCTVWKSCADLAQLCHTIKAVLPEITMLWRLHIALSTAWPVRELLDCVDILLGISISADHSMHSFAEISTNSCGWEREGERTYWASLSHQLPTPAPLSSSPQKAKSWQAAT